jgi:serine/threonine-protein kinase
MTVELGDDPLCGMRLGDYVIESPVGMGGMGIVYRAVHPLIGRRVAVKVLRPELAKDPEQADRFLKEAQALSAVKHRGVIDIITFGKLPDSRQYMVMEFLEGESLDAVLDREGGLSPSRALGLIDEILDALSAAHRAGVVHRDIKPANIFLLTQSNGTRVVKLVDFGLARRTTLENLERAGERTSLMAGTPEYFSPEQAHGLAATPRSDLYAVGVLLFELLSGRLPFQEKEVVELLQAQMNRAPPLLHTVVGGMPDSLETLVSALLAKDPEDRPKSADVARTAVQRVIRELRALETNVGVAPRRSSKEHDTREVPRKQPEAGHSDTQRTISPSPWPRRGAIGLALAALLSIAGWVALRPGPAPVPEPPAPPADQLQAAPIRSVEREPEVPDELAPLGSVAVRPAAVRPKPKAAPPSVCAASSWKDTLRQQVGESQQLARAQKRLTPEAESGLRSIHVALRDSSRDCATLARELEQWRQRFTR